MSSLPPANFAKGLQFLELVAIQFTCRCLINCDFKMTIDPDQDLSCLSTWTIGSSQSANWTGSIIPSATSLSNYFSTKGVIEYGDEHALQNRGETPGMMLYVLPGFKNVLMSLQDLLKGFTVQFVNLLPV